MGRWLDFFEGEHDNLRVALDWLTKQGRVADVLLLAPALSQFWEVRGYAGEGRERLERLLDVPDVDAHARAAGLSGLHALEWSLGDFARMACHGEELLAVCEEIGDGLGVTAALHDLAECASSRTRLVTLPVVKAAGGHTQRSAQAHDRGTGLLRCDEPEPAHRVVSRAK